VKGAKKSPRLKGASPCQGKRGNAVAPAKYMTVLVLKIETERQWLEKKKRDTVTYRVAFDVYTKQTGRG